MAAILSSFLSAALRRPFAWGQHDCMLFVADWAKCLTGEDPGALWRGTYSTEEEAEAILSRGGGPGPILHGALTVQGWKASHGCKAGDICVVRAPTRSGRALTACVFGGRGKFALLTQRGLVLAPVPPASFLLGWRHPNA